MKAERDLPIWQCHEEILHALRVGNRLVLSAPTGSGKTTQIPQMLLDAGLAGAGRVIVLQPRRVAARSVAARVAWERGSRLGGEVGYQVRFDDHTGLGTRICFVTEGILIRWLETDPRLPGVSIIVFDEFHERNLLSDLGLALAKSIQHRLRPDLKLLVMSATLDAEPVASYLGDCPWVRSEGRSHPVTLEYLPHLTRAPVPDLAAEAVARILAQGAPGDILVFMPGKAEILATVNAIRHARAGEPLLILPLHGDLPHEEQDRVFAPAPVRKLVVSTNVAETSITIDGVRFVVDGGLARTARFDTERGISTLGLEPISRASSEQRRGRAGRTAPGHCIRLWTESGQLNRPEKNTPEIQRSDLAEVVLRLHALGVPEASRFDWLDRPDPKAVERAEELLRILGAIAPRETRGSPHPAPQTDAPERQPPAADITDVGRQMLRLPMHPRFSRMLVEAKRRGCVPTAALCAALVGGRDLLKRLGRDDKPIAEARELFEGNESSDFFTLIRAFEFAVDSGFHVDRCRRYGIQAQVAREVADTFDQIRAIVRQAGWAGDLPEPPPAASRPAPSTLGRESDEPLRRSLLAGFVDQLCRRRDQGTLECLVAGDRQGTLTRESVVQKAPLFVSAAIREIGGREGAARTLLTLATAIEAHWIEEMMPGLFTRRRECVYDRTHKRVAALELGCVLGLEIERRHLPQPDPAESARCLAEAVANGHFELPLFTHELRQWIGRVNRVAFTLPELDIHRFDAAALTESFARAFHGLTLAKEAQQTRVDSAIRARLAPGQSQWIDELAPAALTWHDGRRLKLLYPADLSEDPGAHPPELQVKLHECFALTAHPCICENRVPIRLWLTSPDGKRIDSTLDWPAFRARDYPKLKPALQKKFPGVGWL